MTPQRKAEHLATCGRTLIWLALDTADEEPAPDLGFLARGSVVLDRLERFAAEPAPRESAEAFAVGAESLAWIAACDALDARWEPERRHAVEAAAALLRDARLDRLRPPAFPWAAVLAALLVGVAAGVVAGAFAGPACTWADVVVDGREVRACLP